MMVIYYDHVKYRPGRTRHYNVAEAKAHFSTLVRKALQGEEVIIARDNTPLVKLVPVGIQAREPGSARGRVRMADDFDAPLEDLAEYRE